MHESPLRPDFKERSAIEQATRSGFYKCWTCGTCDGGCPVNIVANALRPQKIVRLAYLGMRDELLRLPEIWYCLTCRRCSLICPNLVKPSDIIKYSRETALRQGIVTQEAVNRHQEFFAKFQRVRWHAAAWCMKGSLASLTDEEWDEWLNTPIRTPIEIIRNNGIRISKSLLEVMKKFNNNNCFTCSECSGACPVFCERDLFDPQAIIRMVNLGLAAELIVSPSIWLCLGCERCSGTCSQLVQGHQIIKSLQNLAISQGVVDAFFVSRLEKAEKVIYPRFFAEIDSIFGLKTGGRR
ncbi:MAG: 4Fe-4S dicluster domain-containing protein [Desulfobacteraceae bacterium]|nr:4Fe-4S dicluster domain-containing protein [Desulfobacteraceae bacterium]